MPRLKTSPPRFNRLPFAPLERIWTSTDPNTPAGVIADACGVSRESIQRYKAVGLAYWTADAIAIRLRRHPATIWGDLWWNVDVIDPIY